MPEGDMKILVKKGSFLFWLAMKLPFTWAMQARVGNNIQDYYHIGIKGI
jgi:hypothetical protein